MNERLNWMFPSLTLRRMFLVDVRISWLFLLVPLILCPRYGMEFGVALTSILLVSVLLHEFAHVAVARWTGGMCDEITMTPLGGLGTIRAGQGAIGSALTAAAGPAVNFAICVISFPGWYAPKALWHSLNPLALPITQFHEGELLKDLFLILFAVNWVCLLANMLPALPFDGGQILRAILSTRIHPELVHRTTLQIGLAVAIGLLICGVVSDLSLLVLVGTFVLMINVIPLLHEEMGEAMEDSGYGFDFSTGYESLESLNPTTTRQARPGLLQRWRDRRRMRREQQERIQRLEAEQQLDTLLAKVHETGLQSLSEREQTLLRSCSELLRDRQKSED